MKITYANLIMYRTLFEIVNFKFAPILVVEVDKNGRGCLTVGHMFVLTPCTKWVINLIGS